MQPEHRNSAGPAVLDEARARMAAHLHDLPECQRAYALEVVSCQLDVLDAILGGRQADLTARHRATMRMLGHEWTARRWPLEPLLALLGRVAEEVADVLLGLGAATAWVDVLTTLADVGHRFLAELFNGSQEVAKVQGTQTDPQSAALALLRGHPAPAEGRLKVAPAYGVLAFRITDDTTGPPDRAAAWLAEQADDGVLSLICDQGGYVLVPAEDISVATAFAQRMHTLLPDSCWTGISWRPVAEVPAGRTEATEVVVSALASQRGPGYYELGDVLVEYAVLRHPSVRKLLVELVEPVVHNTVLLETLNALLAANGNRSRAAEALIIHRSTLDYRLGQIARLTGHAPTSSRELEVLSAGLTAHTASRCTLPQFPDWDL